MRIVDLGLIPYREAEALQLETVDAVLAGGEETLFLLEHPPVVTLGRQGGLENLHASPEFLAAQGVDLRHISRGGNITCHFPGQLVAYPVFRIERRPGGVRRFFYDLEEAVIRALDRFGVQAARWEGRPGVWAGAGKICSIGVAVRRWVTYHGLALNVGRDLSLFSRITLCGLPDARPTSVHLELDKVPGAVPPSMDQVKHALAQAFADVFAPA
ncbi:MAG: lipoyl(octanoyl) transferase LipB [Thermodesulfobacteriota bacterium]